MNQRRGYAAVQTLRGYRAAVGAPGHCCGATTLCEQALRRRGKRGTRLAYLSTVLGRQDLALLYQSECQERDFEG